jgi:hypothetical protein
VLAGGTVLLALALGGLRGLVVVIALTVSWGVLRLISIAGAAHDEKRSEECHAQRCEAERKAEQSAGGGNISWKNLGGSRLEGADSRPSRCHQFMPSGDAEVLWVQQSACGSPAVTTSA